MSKSSLSVIYEWNLSPSVVRSIVDGVDPALYTDIDLVVSMGPVRLNLSSLSPQSCFAFVEQYHQAYMQRIRRRHE